MTPRDERCGDLKVIDAQLIFLSMNYAPRLASVCVFASAFVPISVAHEHRTVYCYALVVEHSSLCVRASKNQL